MYVIHEPFTYKINPLCKLALDMVLESSSLRVMNAIPALRFLLNYVGFQQEHYPFF